MIDLTKQQGQMTYTNIVLLYCIISYTLFLKFFSLLCKKIRNTNRAFLYLTLLIFYKKKLYFNMAIVLITNFVVHDI